MSAEIIEHQREYRCNTIVVRNILIQLKFDWLQVNYFNALLYPDSVNYFP